LIALGWAHFVPAALVPLFAGLLFLAKEGIGWSGALVVLVVAGLCWTAGGSCVALGRRMRLRRAEPALGDDPRPLILYLRSFQFDRSWTPEGQPWKMRSTYEEHLARALGRLGPFVAIGRPGEPLPELGAVRLYVEDDRWQQEVRRLMARAGAVVLTAGQSQGLKWELQEAVARLDPQRLLIFVPPGADPRGGTAARQDAYDGFRLWAEGILPKGLPERIETAHFIYFTADWAAHLLLPPEVPFLLGLRRLRIEVPNKTLQPHLERLLQDPLFLTPMRLSPLVTLAGVLPIMGIVLYLLMVNDVSAFVAIPVVVLLLLGIYVGIMAALKKL
jgi:hypothetical protein